MINQPEEQTQKDKDIRLELIQQEVLTLKEAKISLSSEIRNKIREKEQLNEEILILSKSLEEKKKELEEADKDKARCIKTLDETKEKSKEKSNEFNFFVNKMELDKELAEERDKKLNRKELELNELEKGIDKKQEKVKAQIDKITKILNICQ